MRAAVTQQGKGNWVHVHKAKQVETHFVQILCEWKAGANVEKRGENPEAVLTDMLSSFRAYYEP